MQKIKVRIDVETSEGDTACGEFGWSDSDDVGSLMQNIWYAIRAVKDHLNHKSDDDFVDELKRAIANT